MSGGGKGMGARARTYTHIPEAETAGRKRGLDCSDEYTAREWGRGVGGEQRGARVDTNWRGGTIWGVEGEGAVGLGQ
jgi:hypothetical protein